MNGIYGIGINGGSFISSFLGNSTGNSGGGNGNVFSAISTSGLSDLNLIKTGTYKKMLKSYYASSDDNNSLVKNPFQISDDKKQQMKSLAVTRDDSQKVFKAAAELMNNQLYDAVGTDENGNAKYDLDSVFTKVSELVNTYNDLHDSFENIENKSILNKGLNMVGNFSANKNMLEKVGISIKEDNTISVDESKFKASSINDIKTLFGGRGSFASQISSAASSVYSLSVANIAASRVNGSAYTGMGRYNLSSISMFSSSI